MEKKEFAVGEEFQFGLKKLRCEIGSGHSDCKGCIFRDAGCGYFIATCVGECSGNFRSDKTDVIFVEVK